jgi:ubiquinone/menaquinone biosynthesis C-methylase UbiE
MGTKSVIIRAANAFVALNRKASKRLEAHLPHAIDILYQYIEVVKDVVNAMPRNAVVVDVGGGTTCPFARVLKPGASTMIIVLDISEDQLRCNNDANSRLVADVMKSLPFGNGTVDLVTSRSVLEHLGDVAAFVRHSSEVLKPGGYWIHLFPSKFAPFALINQLLPKTWSRMLVRTFFPSQKGICGFPALYDVCYCSAIVNLLLKNGFDRVDVMPSYYQWQYFSFCFPLFVASAAYALLVWLLGLRNLAAYLLVVARKAGP